MPPVESDEQDLTRKQRREAARAQRKALEQAEAASEVRRTRLTQLGIVVAIVVVAVVAILVASGGGGGKHATKQEKTKIAGEVTSLIGGIPQSGNALGSPTAPVTLQYFGDLECPICKDFTLGALPSLIQNWVRSGKLRIEYRSLETATREPEVFQTQQQAALAAGKQQKMWDFVETFYHEQGEENSGYVNEAFLEGIARQVQGLDLAKWASDRKNSELASQVASDAQAANNASFTGTPSFLIGKTGGTMTKYEASSLTEPGPWNEEIEKLLKA